MHKETQKIIERYAKRRNDNVDQKWMPLKPYNMKVKQERELALSRILAKNLKDKNLADLSCIEVGCGTGANLRQLITFGFSPENLMGNELLDYQAETAKNTLPADIQIDVGDALELDIAKGSMDIVYQATVFSSILDDKFQETLANKMWEWVKPSGAILWYDFTFNNPKNPDVRGVPVTRVQELFPEGTIETQRVTLAPPLGRAAVSLSPALYNIFNTVPLLRTHVFCWITK